MLLPSQVRGGFQRQQRKSWNNLGWKRPPKSSIPDTSTALKGEGILGDAGLEQHPQTQETPGFVGEKTPFLPQLPRAVCGSGKGAQKDPWRPQLDGKDGKNRREWKGQEICVKMFF